MTLEEYINKHGSSYPTTQIAFQDFCDIIESESYRAISLTQDLPIARLINYVNTNTNDAIDLNELLSSSVDGMRLFAEYCSQNPNYGSYRIPLLNPYLGVEYIKANFKTTKSYTNAIITNSSVYKVYDRLVVRNVNLDLLLCMKLVAFRKEKKSDIDDINNLVLRFRALGRIMDTNEVCNLIIKYYGSLNVLSKEAKEFLHL